MLFIIANLSLRWRLKYLSFSEANISVPYNLNFNEIPLEALPKLSSDKLGILACLNISSNSAFLRTSISASLNDCDMNCADALQPSPSDSNSKIPPSLSIFLDLLNSSSVSPKLLLVITRS